MSTNLQSSGAPEFAVMVAEEYATPTYLVPLSDDRSLIGPDRPRQPSPDDALWISDTPIWLGEEDEAYRAQASMRHARATFLQGDILSDFWTGQSAADLGADALSYDETQTAISHMHNCAFSIMHCSS